MSQHTTARIHVSSPALREPLATAWQPVDSTDDQVLSLPVAPLAGRRAWRRSGAGRSAPVEAIPYCLSYIVHMY